MKLILKIAPICLSLLTPIRPIEAASRQVGPEPGLQFGTVPSGVSMCAFGSYNRALGSAYDGSCPNLIKMVDDFITHAGTSSSWTFMPFSVAEHYFVRVSYDGGSYNAATSYSSSSNIQYGLNVADSNFNSFLAGEYFPKYLLPRGPNAKNGIPSNSSHPTYVAMDGYLTDYSFLGAWVGDFKSNVKWEPGYAQNATAWLQAWESFFSYAKEHATAIRLAPHIGSMNNPGWSTFHELYANCPAMMRETYKISSLASMGASAHSQYYNEMINLYWFANAAPPVFSTAVNPNEPRTRVVDWGTWLDNGDIHTALAAYSMVRGPNTFFDLLKPGGAQPAVNPNEWLPIANKLGSGTSAPTTIATGSGTGYVLLKRTWQYGTSYLNLTGRTQTVSLPSGSRNWSGTLIHSLTLANGKGDVVVTR